VEVGGAQNKTVLLVVVKTTFQGENSVSGGLWNGMGFYPISTGIIINGNNLVKFCSFFIIIGSQ